MSYRCLNRVARKAPAQPFSAARPLALAIHLAVFGGIFALSSWSPAALAQQGAATQTSRSYDIPAGPLSTVLTRFSSEAGIYLIGAGAAAEGKPSAGLKGRYSIHDGFAALLAGTGLEAFKQAEGSYGLRAVPIGPAEVTLAPVKVKSSGVNATTEGTGSYTAGIVSAATGLPLSLREPPQSVSVITRQRMDDQGLPTLKDVLASAPGITNSELDSERTTFSARGFSIDQLQYDGISTFYDSAYSGGESETDTIIYDRIEIVRGATGLLSGAGNPSASINLIRKHADSKEFKGEVSASVGSWNSYRASVDVSAPLSGDGDVRGRLIYAHEDKDSFVDRYNRKRDIVYGVVDADLTPSTQVSVGVSYQRSDADSITYGGQPTWYSDGSATDFSRSFSFSPKWSYEDTDIINGFVNLDHQFDNGWTLQGLFMRGRNKVDSARLFVWDYPDPVTSEVGLYGAPARIQVPGARNQTSVDLRLSGPFQLAGREHEAIIGLNYFDQKSKYDVIGASLAELLAWTPTSIYALEDLPEPGWADPQLSSKGHIKQSAAFAALRLSLADPVQLIVGGRITRVQRDGYSWNYTYAYDYEKSKFVPYAGVVVDITENLSTYASYTSIFKNQDVVNSDLSPLAPITGDAYETGIKGEFFNGGLNASIAVFKIIQDNLGKFEETIYDAAGQPTDIYSEGEGATSEGIEFEVTGALTPNWNLSFDVTHFKAKDAEDDDVNPNYPRTTAKLFTTYKLSGAWQKLTVGGGANWQSDIYYDGVGANYDSRVEQSAYLVGNLMARYAFSEQLSAQLSVNNVFDKKYETAINWQGQKAWGAPRNLLASLAYTF